MISFMIPVFQYMLVISANKHLLNLYVKHLLEGSKLLEEQSQLRHINRPEIISVLLKKISDILKKLSIDVGNDWDEIAKSLESFNTCISDECFPVSSDRDKRAYIQRYLMP